MLRMSGKKPLQSGAVVLLPGEGASAGAQSSDDVEITPDGRFVFRSVPPGSYQLRARASVDPKQVTLFGTLALTVASGANLESIVVDMRPGATIQGRVEWAGGKRPADIRTLRVRAPFVDGTSFGDSFSGNVSTNGSFRLRGVMAGSHHLTVEGLPAGAAVVSVLIGGKDMALQPIEVRESQQMNNVRIVVSNTGR